MDKLKQKIHEQKASDLNPFSNREDHKMAESSDLSTTRDEVADEREILKEDLSTRDKRGVGRDCDSGAKGSSIGYRDSVPGDQGRITQERAKVLKVVYHPSDNELER